MRFTLFLVLSTIVIFGVIGVFVGRPGGRLKRVIAWILWMLGGIAVTYVSVIIYAANVDSGIQRAFETSVEGFVGVTVIGVFIGMIGYRATKPRSKHPEMPHHGEPSGPASIPIESASATAKKAVFVSYRRNDSADVTGRIYDRLSSRFGSEQVFKDVDSIPLGRDFREVINTAVAKASVVVVVVGRNWIGREEGLTHARILDQTDFVRTEVAAALQQDKAVIPVLVGNAKMPSESDLPDEIKSFAYRNGVNVRPDPDFVHDIARLIKGIEQA